MVPWMLKSPLTSVLRYLLMYYTYVLLPYTSKYLSMLYIFKQCILKIPSVITPTFNYYCSFFFSIEMRQKIMSGSTGETEEDLGTAEELLSSDDEASDNDPFRHRIKMSPLRWLRTYLLTIILIPIKFFLLILTVILSWMVAR